MPVPVLRLRSFLLTSIQKDLTDSQWSELADKMLRRAGDEGVAGAIIDITGMQVMDSYAGRTLSAMGEMLRLRGVQVVVAGIQPDVAFSMSRLGLRLDRIETTLDLDEALNVLGEMRGDDEHG